MRQLQSSAGQLKGVNERVHLKLAHYEHFVFGQRSVMKVQELVCDEIHGLWFATCMPFLGFYRNATLPLCVKHSDAPL